MRGLRSERAHEPALIKRLGKPSAYRRHARGMGTVRIAHRDFYLGPYGSAQSWKSYRDLLELWESDGCPRPWLRDFTRAGLVVDRPPLLDSDIVAKYRVYADEYYRKDGKPTGEVDAIDSALEFLELRWSTLVRTGFHLDTRSGPVAPSW